LELDGLGYVSHRMQTDLPASKHTSEIPQP
jgi:hypothetical protein